MKKILRNNYGFTLVGAVVAMAIMGVVAYMGMQVTKQSTKITTGMNETIDRTSVLSRLQILTGNVTSCENSFKGLNAHNSSGTSVDSIKNSSNNPVFSPGQKIGKMNIDSIEIFPIGSPGSYDSESFRLNIKLAGSGRAYGVKNYSKDLVINASIDPSNGEILSCNPMSNHIVEQAVIMACNGPGAYYDSASKTCIITSVGEEPACPAGHSINAVNYDEETNMYKIQCSVVFESSLCIQDGEEGYVIGFDDNGPVCGYPTKNFNTSNLVDTTPVPVSGCDEMGLVVDPNSNKVKLECVSATPVACTCTQWGPWVKFAASYTEINGGCGGTYRPFRKRVRTTCNYKRSCVAQGPAGCVGNVGVETTGYQTKNYPEFRCLPLHRLLAKSLILCPQNIN